jgi:hypothetical protein
MVIVIINIDNVLGLGKLVAIRKTNTLGFVQLDLSLGAVSEELQSRRGCVLDNGYAAKTLIQQNVLVHTAEMDHERETLIYSSFTRRWKTVEATD